MSLVFYHVNSTESIESTIVVSLKCDLELQKHFSQFTQAIKFYGDTNSLAMIELLEQLNKDRCYRDLNFDALSGFNSSIIVVLSFHHFCHQISLVHNFGFGISASEDEFHTLRFGIDEL